MADGRWQMIHSLCFNDGQVLGMMTRMNDEDEGHGEFLGFEVFVVCNLGFFKLRDEIAGWPAPRRAEGPSFDGEILGRFFSTFRTD